MPYGKGTYGSKKGRPPKREPKIMAKNVSLKIGKHKSRSGGLTKAGREKYNRETGSNLKAPQPKGGPRKKSFCARMGGVKGPMKKW